MEDRNVNTNIRYDVPQIKGFVKQKSFLCDGFFAVYRILLIESNLYIITSKLSPKYYKTKYEHYNIICFPLNNKYILT